jgi:hypothetical protein
MQNRLILLSSILLAACPAATECRLDDDCADLEYCYRAPIADLEAAEGTEPGYPYQEFGTCTSDCTTDADCHGSARCTPKGICKDLTLNSERQWTGYEPGLDQLQRVTRYAPLLSCQAFMTCVLNCESEPDNCNDCVLAIDPPSQSLAMELWICVNSEACNGQTWAVCLNNACLNEKLMCRDDR